MDIDGGNVRPVVKDSISLGPECTPDGQWLLFQVEPSDIRRVRPDGTAAAPLAAKGMNWALAVSPGGTHVAALRPDPARLTDALAVTPVQGGGPERTHDVPRGVGRYHPSLRWAPDGRALSYVMTTRGTSNIWTQPVTGGAPRQLTNFTEGLIWAHSWSADGRLALARGRVNEDIVLVTSEGRK